MYFARCFSLHFFLFVFEKFVLDKPGGGFETDMTTSLMHDWRVFIIVRPLITKRHSEAE